MKPPLHAQRHIYESGYGWSIYDSAGKRIFDCWEERYADFIVALINSDYEFAKAERLTGDVTDALHECEDEG